MSPNVQISVREVSAEVCLQSLANPANYLFGVSGIMVNRPCLGIRVAFTGLLGNREHSKKRENGDSYRVLCFRLRVKPRQGLVHAGEELYY